MKFLSGCSIPVSLMCSVLGHSDQNLSLKLHYHAESMNIFGTVQMPKDVSKIYIFMPIFNNLFCCLSCYGGQCIEQKIK